MSVLKVLPLAALSALMLVPVPAQAKADHPLSQELADPRKQQAIGDMLGALIGVMLDMPADPLARMAEAAGDRGAARKFPRGATLGDLAGPEARRLPREVRRRAPAMVGAMGELTAVLEDMAPEFERIGRDFERRMQEAD
ncbi:MULTISPECIES: hypothetical protein [unclassified Novosphingobium]|uniref:hypothetical protein n=1 Tax=unclassified Novosphingobium TaxID=2644732 RepID=UPI000EE1CD32|nr:MULTISPECIES: hypothetical protein [unclassified Novosphingobium]HCF24379.1 hypothetical protein [Novosphingobium sp.]HQV03759.1 hypothetical protein [Novosphingobium sp.]